MTFDENLQEINTFINSLLQFEGRKATITLVRFGINTTLGILGLFDIASKLKLPKQYEDFGLTLAKYGVGNGPYLVLPLFGPLLFMRYGYYPYHKNKKKDIFDVRKYLDKVYKPKSIKLSQDQLFNKLSKYSTHVFKSKLVNGSIERIEHLESIYQESIDMVRSAKNIILINFYIISDSEWLKSLSNELILKAKQGVKIYIIYDPFGSKHKYPLRLMHEFEKNGIRTCQFKPKQRFILTSADNNRSHKKVLIVDGQVALYGGVNISDEYINYSSKYHFWFDEAFKLSGEIVNELTKSYIIDWSVYSNDKDRETIYKIIDSKSLCPNVTKSKSLMQVYDSNPETLPTRMEQFLSLAFANAKKRIMIYTPYLYLNETMINLLISQREAGVPVKIILPRLPDNKKFIIHINQLQYKKLLEHGVEIYEIDGFIHRKSIIVDDIVIAGTCNLDQRAMTLNYESSIMIKDKKFLQESIKEFNKSLDISKKINLDFKKDISLKNKFLVKLLMITETLL